MSFKMLGGARIERVRIAIEFDDWHTDVEMEPHATKEEWRQWLEAEFLPRLGPWTNKP